MLLCLVCDQSIAQSPNTQQANQPSDRGHQVQIRMSIGFANQLFARTVSRSEPITESILGAHVKGRQSTIAKTSLQFLNNAAYAELRILTNGHTTSYTHAYRSGIVVKTQGLYEFLASKDVRFRKLQLVTRLPKIQVLPQQDNVGLRSPATGVPVIGPVVDHTALHIANQQKPKSEIIAAQRLTARLSEEVNKTVDKQLANANQLIVNQLGSISSRMSKKDTRLDTSTSQNELVLRAYYPCDNCSIKAGESYRVVPWPAQTQFRNRLSVAIHQAFVNELFGVQRLAGQKISDKKFDALVKYATDNLLAGNWKEAIDPRVDQDVFDETQVEMAYMLMDREKPIWLQYADGKVRLKLRAEFETPAGIKTSLHEITIQYQPTITKDRVILKHETTLVSPMLQQNADQTSEAITMVIQQTFQRRARDIKLQNHIPLPSSEKSLWLNLERMTLQAGWLMLNFNLSDR